MKEWLIRLTLIVFGLIISVSAIEFGLSKFAPNPRTWTRGFYEQDEYIGWKGIPGKEVNYVVGRESSYVKINSHGFRDRERTYEKKEDTFRIVVLGDSMCAAVQVPLEGTFPYILEEKLNSEGSKRFEVINLAMPGFGTAQEYLTLKHYGLKYQPDLVILAFMLGNDVRDNSLTLNSEYGDTNRPFFVLNNDKLEEIPFKIPNKDEEQTKRDVNGQFQIRDILAKVFPNIYYSLDDRINETPWLANFLWKTGIKNSKPGLLKKDANLIDHYVYAEEYTPEWQNAWDVTKALILKLANELKMDKIGFLVVVIPNEFEFRPDIDIRDRIPKKIPQMKTLEFNTKFDIRKPEHILSSFLETNKIDYLLLRPEFEKYSKETGKDLNLHYAYDNHWNANGHALVAELVYKKLKDDKKLVSIKEENKQ